MTVSISVSVGSNHPNPVKAQRETWKPQSDDGSTFTPGAWADEGDVETIAQGTSRSYTVDAGQSVKIWEDAQDPQEA